MQCQVMQCHIQHREARFGICTIDLGNHPLSFLNVLSHVLQGRPSVFLSYSDDPWSVSIIVVELKFLFKDGCVRYRAE